MKILMFFFLSQNNKYDTIQVWRERHSWKAAGLFSPLTLSEKALSLHLGYKTLNSMSSYCIANRHFVIFHSNHAKTTQCCGGTHTCRNTFKSYKETLKQTMFNSIWATRDINQNAFLHQHAGQYEEVLLDRCMCVSVCVFVWVCVHHVFVSANLPGLTELFPPQGLQRVSTIRPKICNKEAYVS